MKSLVAFAFFVSGSAFAFPLPPADSAPATSADVSNSLTEVDFTAIVALSNCSGAVVRFATSLGTDRAMVLTNGHCLGGGFLKPGEVRVDQPVSRSFTLLSKDARTQLGKLNGDRVMYATMTSTDMTLYRLVETYEDIEKRFGLTALTLASARSVAGRKIAIASGYWRRMYQCSIERFVPTLREADWTFKDSIRYSEPGCDTIGGTSGSPIIDAETREVVGVNNTTNEDGQRCTINNPCEVDDAGNVNVEKGTSYGQQIFWVYGCLGSNNTIDLTKAGCQLPR